MIVCQENGRWGLTEKKMFATSIAFGSLYMHIESVLSSKPNVDNNQVNNSTKKCWVITRLGFLGMMTTIPDLSANDILMLIGDVSRW